MWRLGLTLSFLLAASVAHAAPLNLVCFGSGSATKPAGAMAFGPGGAGDAVTIVGQRGVGFEDQVNVEIDDAEVAKIRMPRAMLPPLHGGKDGWFQIDELKTTDTEISGKVQVSLVSKPKLRLDRITGHINVTGKIGTFAGECEPFDPAKVQRKF